MWIVSLLLIVLFWFGDAAVDATIFMPEKNFLQSLLEPEPVELWMRSVISTLLLGFGIYAGNAVREQREAHQALYEQRAQLQAEIERRKSLEAELREQADTDPLTSVYNRRRFYEFLQYELERVQRYDGSFSLILCDIDHFKQINDRYGHHVGDEALKSFCGTISANLRSVDVMARWGGEEFAILAPGIKLPEAVNLAEKLRQLTHERVLVSETALTISLGVTEYQLGDDSDSLLKRVDEALYLAKQRGRNRAVAAP
jgi:diguanylate cyclase (GGDEF)-like protein